MLYIYIICIIIIHELFGDGGRVRFSALHHDGIGRSLCTADVVFERAEDAQKAVRGVLRT